MKEMNYKILETKVFDNAYVSIITFFNDAEPTIIRIMVFKGPIAYHERLYPDFVDYNLIDDKNVPSPFAMFELSDEGKKAAMALAKSL